jgi:tRNA(Ile)-lysidine synthase
VVNSLIEQFEFENISYTLFHKQHLIIIAISGGLDSVVLTHLLKSIGQPIMLAHCNFQLRGAESERDEAYVRTLASEWKIPLHIRRFDTKAYAHEQKVGIQVAARQLRYDFFEALRQQFADQGRQVLIATAHHANDHVETVLMHLFRGTGIDGLRGIPKQNGYIIRPLLFAKRQALEDYAMENQLSWVEDSSNEKEDYTRNYIRHTVIPAVEKQFPALVENIQASSLIFRDVSALYHEAVANRLKKLVTKENGLEKVPVLKLIKMDQANTILFEWMKGYGFTQGQTGEVMKLTNAANGSYVASATHRIIRNRAWLIMAPLLETSTPLQIIEELSFTVSLANGHLLKIQQPQPYASAAGIPKLPVNEIWVDASKISLPLIIRSWKQGDYFYPLGMRKKKKIARFLIDSKVSPLEKEKIMVLESKGRIIWVMGHRMDDRFKILPVTKIFIRMSFQ